ncbi:AEC family transporter [Coprothermobacter platensis]|uniref:AEC family transporter n=1 Tax=Coprothermobacter platensis TaxID=108819 RepID=UPI00058BCC70|nr:AEC family transporter [Coprothermobacter platensis]
MSSIITFLCLLILGYVFKVSGFLLKTDADAIRKLVFNVCLPCMAFKAMHGSALKSSFLLIICGVVLLHVLGYVLFRLSNGRLKDVVFAGWAGNTAFIGYPIVEGLFGLDGLSRGVIFDQTNTVMIILLWMQKGIKSIFSPPLVGAFLGLLLHNMAIPVPMSDAISMLASVTSPLAMIYTGYVLQMDWDVRVLPALFLKFLVLPLLAMAVSSLLNLPLLDRDVMVVQSSMPTMVVSIIYGEQMGLDTAFLSKAVVISTLIYPLSFLLWNALL